MDRGSGDETEEARRDGPRPEAREVVRRIPAEVWEARIEARALRDEAQAEARRIREEASGEVEAARAAAVAAGREEGLAGAAAALLRAAEERDRILAGCAGEVVDLAAEVASRVLAREVRPGADALAAAERALGVLRGRACATVRASPGDVAALRAAAAGGAAGAGLAEVIPDATLSPGEVIVEAAGGTVDARFRTAVDALHRAMREAVQ